MASINHLIPLIVFLPLAGAIINGLLGPRLPRAIVGLVANLAVLGSFVISVMAFWQLHQHPGVDALSATLYTWLHAGNLNVDVRFVVDHLSSIMTLVVTGVGFLIHLYSVGYMEHDPAVARYFAYLNLFTFAMLVLVLGDSLPLMFVGWEGVGLCSYLLIGFWYTDNDKATAGKKAFIVNRIGDFGFIVAMLLLFRVAGTLRFAGLHNAVATGHIGSIVATAACLLLLLGATGKSAQIPLFVWLPDAMAGPTPVSALIHAATMVTAGVYMTARMGFMFSIAPTAMIAVAFIGALTALVAASIGTAQNDIKKVLAYSTVSQLGFMFIAAGVGAYAVAVFHLVTHAFFKGGLFLCSGSVIHGMNGEQDMRQMGGLWKKQPITFFTMLAMTLAIIGAPFTAGFISKDAILWSAWSSSMGGHASAFASYAVILWVLGVVAAGLTSFYMWRLMFMTFFSGELRASKEVAEHVHESPWTMTVPLIVLGTLSLVGGVLAWPELLGGHEWLFQWLRPAVGAGTGVTGEHVGLEWILMGTATAAALIAFLAAYFLYARRISPVTNRFATERPFSWLYERLRDKWNIDELYDAVVVQPIGWVSRVVLYEGLDRRIIDGLVNFVGWLGRTLGFVGQLFQSGNVQRYIAIFAIALALLIYGWLTPFSAQSLTSHTPQVAVHMVQGKVAP